MAKLSGTIKAGNGEFVRGKSRRQVLFSLHEAIGLELDRGIEEKRRLLDRLCEADGVEYRALIENEGFNVDECRDAIASMCKDRKKCTAFECEEREKDSCLGDVELGRVYESGRRVDVMTIVNSLDAPGYAWVLSDCKFAMKKPTYSIVCATDNFNEDVAEKFDSVENNLKADREPFWHRRVVLVTSEAAPIIRRYREQHALGSAHPLVATGRYEICTVDTVGETVKHARNQYREAGRGNAAIEGEFG